MSIAPDTTAQATSQDRESRRKMNRLLIVTLYAVSLFSSLLFIACVIVYVSLMGFLATPGVNATAVDSALRLVQGVGVFGVFVALASAIFAMNRFLKLFEKLLSKLDRIQREL